MDGQVEFSQSHHQLEDMMLIHMMLEINFVKNIGERMLNSLNSKTDTICHSWIQDQEKPGDFGTGNSPHVVDGLFGDTSTLIIMEELGLGLILNHTQIAEPFEQLVLILMIRIFIFLITD